VEFFGRPASTHKAIALFSLANEAPLVVCAARRLGEPLVYEMGVEAMLDPGDGREPRRELPSHISGAQTVATDALRIADDLVKGALEAFHE
jgi:hypothetical protein